MRRKLINDSAIPYLVNKLNEHQSKVYSNTDTEKKSKEKRLAELNKQLDNIIDAISQGMIHDTFKKKVDDLEEEIHFLEVRIKELSLYKPGIELTEQSIKKLLSVFKQFVTERNIPECKKFIQNYVERVVVLRTR